MAEQNGKMGIRQIRDEVLALLRGNDPKADPAAQNEARTVALGHLVVELCDRVTDLGVETGQWFNTLHGEVQAFAGKTEGSPPVLPPDAPVVAVGGNGAPVDLGAQAAAELAAIPAAMQGKVTQVTPSSAPPPPTDAAAIAAQMNGATGVPKAM